MIKKCFYLAFSIMVLSASAASGQQNPSIGPCQKNSDCAYVIYACNQAAAFNKTQLAEQKKKLCESEDCSLRDCQAFRHFNHFPQCLNGECHVKSIAKDDLDPGGKKWIKRFVYTNRPNFAKKKNEKTPVSLGIVSKPAK